MIEIRSFMFFSAGYAPKNAVKDNFDLNLRIAITNAYGLFKDCSKYINRAWIGKLCDLGLLDKNDKKYICDYIELICALRSLFCHNQNGDCMNTLENVDRVLSFVKGKMGLDVDNSNFAVVKLPINS